MISIVSVMRLTPDLRQALALRCWCLWCVTRKPLNPHLNFQGKCSSCRRRKREFIMSLLQGSNMCLKFIVPVVYWKSYNTRDHLSDSALWHSATAEFPHDLSLERVLIWSASSNCLPASHDCLMPPRRPLCLYMCCIGMCKSRVCACKGVYVWLCMCLRMHGSSVPVQHCHISFCGISIPALFVYTLITNRQLRPLRAATTCWCIKIR